MISILVISGCIDSSTDFTSAEIVVDLQVIDDSIQGGTPLEDAEVTVELHAPNNTFEEREVITNSAGRALITFEVVKTGKYVAGAKFGSFYKTENVTVKLGDSGGNKIIELILHVET